LRQSVAVAVQQPDRPRAIDDEADREQRCDDRIAGRESKIRPVTLQRRRQEEGGSLIGELDGAR